MCKWDSTLPPTNCLPKYGFTGNLKLSWSFRDEASQEINWYSCRNKGRTHKQTLHAWSIIVRKIYMRTCNKINVPLKTDIMFKMIKLGYRKYCKIHCCWGYSFQDPHIHICRKYKLGQSFEIKLAALFKLPHALIQLESFFYLVPFI